jgi:hypothetical protein
MGSLTEAQAEQRRAENRVRDQRRRDVAKAAGLTHNDMRSAEALEVERLRDLLRVGHRRPAAQPRQASPAEEAQVAADRVKREAREAASAKFLAQLVAQPDYQEPTAHDVSALAHSAAAVVLKHLRVRDVQLLLPILPPWWSPPHNA